MEPRPSRSRRSTGVPSTWISFILLSFLLQSAIASTPVEDFEACKQNEDYGQTGLICDPTHTLKNATIEKLDSLLRGLQNNAKRPAKCTENGQEAKKYVGLLQVTNSQSVEESGSDLKTNAKRIYESVPLGNTDCDNGVLIFFIKDKQQLATYNGNDHFVQLTNADIDKLHRLSGGKDDDAGALALQFLKGDQDGEVQRAETWAPVVGLTAALVLILLLLALCLAIFLAKFCCCAGRSKKNKYYVTPVPPSYKTVDPIYIVTPPPSEHHGPHSDIIYSTPYSGTPLPPQSVFAVPTGFYGGAHTPRSNYNRSVTPTSTSRVKINSQNGLGHGKPTEQTPRANKKDKINRTETSGSKHSNATYQVVNNSGSTLPADGASPQSNLEVANRSAASGELPFLDPKRKLETQTREDFIS
ncbi:hypothetical protein M3Y99_01010600 [Aphelenchoides fujianensis]|nr:hypothetical protein M3Y99_01010600 [Aphelenchoides fujianensis]